MSNSLIFCMSVWYYVDMMMNRVYLDGVELRNYKSIDVRQEFPPPDSDFYYHAVNRAMTPFYISIDGGEWIMIEPPSHEIHYVDGDETDSFAARKTVNVLFLCRWTDKNEP